MLDSILKFQSEYEKLARKNKEFHLQNATWKLINSIHRVLKPSYGATLQMQKEQITITDIYITWNLMIRETEAMDGSGLYS